VPPISDPNPDPQKSGVKDAISVKWDSFQRLIYPNFAGLMSTVLALALLSKVDVLEKLIHA